MALTLPTLTIIDKAKSDRVMAAFKSDPVEYKKWLKQALIREVQQREVQAISAENQARIEAKIAEVGTLLDDA